GAVTAGNTLLVEGQDYEVDYATGQVQITNPAILNANQEVNIDYEKADLFNFQTRRLLGTRLDYEFSENFILGASIMNLTERPVISRVNIADEPVNNTMVGADVNYQGKSRFLTRLVDRIPLIQTKEESNITLYGEYAQLFPGASRLSGQVSFIDDFEGTRTAFNLVRAPQLNWKLASTPFTVPGATSRDLDYGFRRAKLAWYNVDNTFYLNRSNATPDNVDVQNHYVRQVSPQELFPKRQPLPFTTNEVILDLAYYPSERGPYNYNPNLNPNGTLPNPRQNFAAISRAITSDIDFDNANVEYIEFWLLDPFIQGENGRVLDGVFNRNNTTGGDLFIQMGNVSEDVIPDGRHAFENGLPADGDTTETILNTWGVVTTSNLSPRPLIIPPAPGPIRTWGWMAYPATKSEILSHSKILSMLCKQSLRIPKPGNVF
ncbi:MAG: cell surface protein SprA, partial [Bacteroidia bacterium]|nr:cell surface protein SprA [Bacteroidia bacterium]